MRIPVIYVSRRALQPTHVDVGEGGLTMLFAHGTRLPCQRTLERHLLTKGWTLTMYGWCEDGMFVKGKCLEEVQDDANTNEMQS